MFSMKHRELEQLRFQDHSENMMMLKNQRYKKNCTLDEKHIALSVMNTDKKLFNQQYNDKFRAKIAKEMLTIRDTTAGAPIEQLMKKQHMSLVTYAPDMVKWTKRDIKKLLADKKPPE